MKVDRNFLREDEELKRHPKRKDLISPKRPAASVTCAVPMCGHAVGHSRSDDRWIRARRGMDDQDEDCWISLVGRRVSRCHGGHAAARRGRHDEPIRIRTRTANLLSSPDCSGPSDLLPPIRTRLGSIAGSERQSRGVERPCGLVGRVGLPLFVARTRCEAPSSGCLPVRFLQFYR